MKKFLVFIVLLAMTTPFIFAEDIEAVAGEANYKIDMKLHNFVEKAYGNTIASEICLPVYEKLKIYIDASFSDDSNMAAAGTGGYYNNYLNMYFGIPITDTIHFTVMLGGGTAISRYQWYDNSAWNIMYNDFDATTLTGEGVLNVGLGLKLKSALFADAINDLYIRQNFKFHLNGNGNAGGITADGQNADGSYKSIFGMLVGPSVNAVGGDTITSELGNNGGFGWGAFYSTSPGFTNYQNYQYWGMDYSGTIGTGINLSAVSGLPKLALAFELGYGINYIAYTKTDEYTYVSEYWGRYNDTTPNGQIRYSINNDGNYEWLNVYNTKPSMIGGDFSLKINLQINPNENVESETWVTPGFAFKSYSWEYFNSENGKSTFTAPEFYLKVGANWKYSFPKYVWIKLDCEWKFSVSNASVLLDGTTLDLIKAEGSRSVTLFNKIDPGLTVGFNLTNWSIEAKWKPAIAIPANGDVSNGGIIGADSNVLNLANWDVGVSVSFPPPAK